ncbi:hypothetical protein ACSS6W_006361 [Trichoderma asperelloides]
MAPPIRTYGKKRSAIGPWGSRSRPKTSTDLSPAKMPGMFLWFTKHREEAKLTMPDPPSPSINACCETMTQTTQSLDNGQPTSIERIASALLDDSSSELPEEEAIQQTEKDLLDASTSTPPVLEDITSEVGEQRICSHSPSSSKDRASSSSRSYRPSAPRIQKTSPNNRFAKSSRPRRNSTSSPKRKDCSLIRPLTSPLRNSANRSSYIIVKDSEAICLLPHNVMDGAPRILLQGEMADEKCAMGTNPDDIQEKVCAMLAATDALKPSSQPRKSPISKMSRMTPSRMLAKVSNAWDRLQVKSSNSGPNPRSKLTKQPIQEDIDGPLTSHPVFSSPILRRTPLIDAIEIRLNEGDNLNRKKVQQMVGGCVPRKPVANDGKALRSGRSIDDPFAEPALLHSPKMIENHANLKVMIGSNRTSLLIIDPFEAERGFDSNLEDGILSSSPVCASTPRIHLHRVQTPTMNDSLDEQCSKLPTQTSLEKMKTGLTTVYQSQEVVSLKKTPSQSGYVRPLPNTDRVKVGLMRDNPTLDACATKWTKKHPSPSKRDLEELEIAFRCYSELKKRGIGEEADELAAHYSPSSRYLSPRDTNRMMAVREEGTKPLSACADQFPARAQARRPTDDLRGHRIRLAPPYRPIIPQSDETDELL